MTEEEHRTAWVKAEYIVLGWWPSSILEYWQPNGFDDNGNLIHYYYG